MTLKLLPSKNASLQRFTAEPKDVSAGRVSSRQVSPQAPKGFETIFAEAGQSDRMRSLLVVYQGELVAEAYFNSAGPETVANLKSVTKSLTSALVGGESMRRASSWVATTPTCVLAI